MTVHVGEIYTFDKDTAAIDVRYPSDFALETLIDENNPASLRQIHVASGLTPHDFGLFINVLNEDWLDRESFLMTSYMKRGRGVIIPSDDVLARPENHLTSELARKIALADSDCIRQFGLGSLIDAVKIRYPNIK